MEVFWRIGFVIVTSGVVIGGVVAIVFGWKRWQLEQAKNWIEMNSTAWESLKTLAYDAVVAAQQMFDANGEKKEYVINFLADHTNMEEEDILVALEEAVKTAKKAFGDQWNALGSSSSS